MCRASDLVGWHCLADIKAFKLLLLVDSHTINLRPIILFGELTSNLIAMSSTDYDSSEHQKARSIKRQKRDSGDDHATGSAWWKYQPLPRSQGTIRILELFSSENPAAKILCAFQTPAENERHRHPYEALSWCWGTAGKSAEIRIQRNRETYTKNVSPNLVAAMKALRYPDRSRYLWIDQVCIDQDE